MNSDKDTGGAGDEWLARDLEGAADEAAAATPTIEWEALGRLELRAKAMAAKGELTVDGVAAMIEEAKRAAPPKRQDVVDALRRDLLALLTPRG